MDRDSFVWRRTEIRNATFESRDLKRLHGIVQSRMDIILRQDKEKWNKNNPEIEEEKKREIPSIIDDNYKTTSIIMKRSGESLSFENKEIFDEIDNWNEIESIIIDASFRYKVNHNRDLNPTVKIEISLMDASIMNPSALISSGSMNQSYALVSGSDENWCAKTYSDISSFISQKSNFRNLIHTKFVYDALMWLLYIPTLIYILWRNNQNLRAWEQNNSLIVTYFMGFGILMIALLLFRFIFDYLRWLFPTIEIKESNTARNANRYLLAAIPFGGIFAAVWRLL